MMKSNKIGLLSFVLAVTIIMGTFVSCTKTSTISTTTLAPLGGSLVQSDSIITGDIQAIKSMATGYPWEIDVLVKSSQDVDTLVNPTSDKVGQIVQFRTDENTEGLKVGQSITAHVKLTGDVIVGTTLYIYDIK